MIRGKFKIAMLGAAIAATPTALRAVGSGGLVRVNSEAGVLYGVAICTIGEAVGHGFAIDALSIQQIADAINQSDGGIRVRFKHPKLPSDDEMGTMVGRVKNATVVGNSVRADVHLGSYSTVMPGAGDVRSYILALAQEDPSAFGMSCVIAFDREPVPGSDLPVARINSLEAVDFVGRPAANPRGLLGKPLGNFKSLARDRVITRNVAAALATEGRLNREQIAAIVELSTVSPDDTIDVTPVDTAADDQPPPEDENWLGATATVNLWQLMRAMQMAAQCNTEAIENWFLAFYEECAEAGVMPDYIDPILAEMDGSVGSIVIQQGTAAAVDEAADEPQLQGRDAAIAANIARAVAATSGELTEDTIASIIKFSKSA